MLGVEVGWYLNNVLIVMTRFDLMMDATLAAIIYLILSEALYLNTRGRKQLYKFIRSKEQKVK